jgi:4-diphosphocytidyl-2-C-methyl-D-erythritol kinase
MNHALTEVAHAKVNLTLHVTARRDDYHLLDSVVVFAGVGDVVEARPSDTLTLKITGPFSAGLAQEPDNLVLRAARLLGAELDRPASAALRLEKNLPVASGIGGGSADAAATLRLLSRLWDIADAPLSLAQQLGADVPVCIRSRPARMRGIGEVLEPLPSLPRLGLLLVNPGVPLSTADVFRARSGGFSIPAPLPPSWDDAGQLAAWLRLGSNDLEPAARAIRPEIGTVLDAIASAPDCLLARMSGSGATCFGLFPEPEAASRVAAMMRHPGWWCWGGPLA